MSRNLNKVAILKLGIAVCYMHFSFKLMIDIFNKPEKTYCFKVCFNDNVVTELNFNQCQL